MLFYLISFISLFLILKKFISYIFAQKILKKLSDEFES